MNEIFYTLMRVSLIRIASGTHEDQTPLTVEDARIIAQEVLKITPSTTMADKYTEKTT